MESDTQPVTEGSPRRVVGGVILRGVTVALVAAVAFFGGLAVDSHGTSASSVVARIPLLGDGLDATVDQTVDFTDFWKAWNALEANYVVTHASSTLPTTKEKLLGAIQGLADSYGDPYTVFFPPEEAKVFQENIAGNFGGVGMEIDVKNGVLVVVAPLKGTPAEAAGILAGDQIIAIDGKPSEGLSTEAAVTKIRGPVGTTVALTLLRENKRVDVKIVRAIIQVPQTEDGIDAKSGVYHIALYEFTGNATRQFNDAFKRFKSSGAKKLVIDLRGNPGGYLDAAVHIASHFLPKGATIVTEDHGGKQENDVHTSIGFNDIPAGTTVVVLIDQGSASASEILAGALQDNDVATVIGMRSFGKGSVQQLIDIAGGSLKVSVARWLTPAGHSIMARGIVPDIAATTTAADITAEKDPQMDRAVQFLTTGK